MNPRSQPDSSTDEEEVFLREMDDVLLLHSEDDYIAEEPPIGLPEAGSSNRPASTSTVNINESSSGMADRFTPAVTNESVSTPAMNLLSDIYVIYHMAENNPRIATLLRYLRQCLSEGSKPSSESITPVINSASTLAQQPTKSPLSARISARVKRKRKASPTTVDNSCMPSGKRACWNCHKNDHVYSDCPDPKGFFCRMCGRSGYTAKTCPKCGDKWKTNRRKNPYRRPRNSRDHSPPPPDKLTKI